MNHAGDGSAVDAFIADRRTEAAAANLPDASAILAALYEEPGRTRGFENPARGRGDVRRQRSRKRPPISARTPEPKAQRVAVDRTAVGRPAAGRAQRRRRFSFLTPTPSGTRIFS